MSGGGGNTSVTQTSTPPAYLAPYLTNLADLAQQNFGQQLGQPYYPGTSVIPFSPETQAALGLATNQALGSPLTPAAESQATQTLNGAYLNGDPYLDQAYQHAAGQVGNAVASSFAGSGRLRSGAYANALGSAEGNLANQMYGGNYQAERARQLQALSLAPSAQAMGYTDVSQLGQVGQARESQLASQLNDALSRYTYAQQQPTQALSTYASLLGSNPGLNFGSSRSQQPTYSNPLGTGLGIASTLGGLGLQAYNAGLFGSTAGTAAAGAGLGAGTLAALGALGGTGAAIGGVGGVSALAGLAAGLA